MELDTLLAPLDSVITLDSEVQPNKRGRKRSVVWEYFTIEPAGAGCSKACCKLCKQSFAYITGSKLSGTSHLKRHINGTCPAVRQRNQSSSFSPVSKAITSGNSTNPPRKQYRAAPPIANIAVDRERCNEEIAKMIIMHEYPLHIVEQSGFVNFVKSLNPSFNMGSFSVIQGDCVALYLREKQSILNLMSGISGRVNLTLNMWTSEQTLGYVLITGQFMDSDWNLHRLLLNVVAVPSPYSNDAFSPAVSACFSDWCLEGRLFTLTVDQTFLNDTVVENLRGFLSVKNPLVFNGQLLIPNCYADVLSLLARDALGSLAEIVWKVRESVKYVKSSDLHEEKFIELMHQLQVPSTTDIQIDDLTKWDTTFHMLVRACELKEVFTCLDASDPGYSITLSIEEWRQVETLCIYLKYFFDATCILTTPIYPTANAFFPELSKIQMELTSAVMSHNPFISNLIKPLLEKFEKYWKDCCIVLAIAVVMDPRYKMKLVEFTFNKLYGVDSEAWIKIVEDGLHQLYLDYMVQTFPVTETFEVESNEIVSKTETEMETVQGDHEESETFLSTDDGLSDFDIYISEITNGQQTKSELDQYFEESLFPRATEFNILNWWRLNKGKYPILSRMASDILSILVSTVAPDSVFRIGLRKMDSYRSSLRPATLEALFCAKDWLQCGLSSSSSVPISNAAMKMETLN